MPGRVVVVTGGSAGVGRALVRKLAARGDAVGIIARGRDGLRAAAREAEEAGAAVCAVSADVADPDAVERAAARIEERLGPVDIWINNAMATVYSRVSELRPEELRRVTEVTYLGAAYGTMAALRRMLPRDRGTIVQVGSALAHRSIPLQAAYCGAKHALRGFTESLRCELLHDRSRVRVTMVQLPALNTPQFSWGRSRLGFQPQPVPPIYQPELAADAVLWAAERAPKEARVGFETVKAVLGQKVMPVWLDRYLARTGYSAQMVKGAPLPSDRRDNLFAPVPGDHGARGMFDDRARSSSLQFWLASHRAWMLAGLGAGGWLAYWWGSRNGGRRPSSASRSAAS